MLYDDIACSCALLNDIWKKNISLQTNMMYSNPVAASGSIGFVQYQIIHSIKLSNNVWDEIIYPFLNFNGCSVDV